MKKLLKLLEKDAHLSPRDLAVMCEKEEGDIKKMIEDFEKRGVILGYTTVIDWDKTDTEYVNALIELKVTPRVGSGYDEIAERIYNYPEVESLYLMSGGFDLAGDLGDFFQHDGRFQMAMVFHLYRRNRGNDIDTRAGGFFYRFDRDIEQRSIQRQSTTDDSLGCQRSDRMQEQNIGFAVKKRSRLNDIDTQSVEQFNDLDLLFEPQRTSCRGAYPECRIGNGSFVHFFSTPYY